MKKLIVCLMVAVGVIHAEDIKIKAGDKIFFRENESWFGIKKVSDESGEFCEIVNSGWKKEIFKKGDIVKIEIGYPHDRFFHKNIMTVKDFDEDSITFYVDTKDLPEIYYIKGYHNNWVKNPDKWDE